MSRVGRNVLAICAAAVVAVTIVAGPAVAGSWQPYYVREVDGGSMVAKVEGNFYSSTVDQKVEFRGTVWAKSGECAQASFFLVANDIELPIAGKPKVCGGSKNFDSDRFSTGPGVDRIRVRICQVINNFPDDCENRYYEMVH